MSCLKVTARLCLSIVLGTSQQDTNLMPFPPSCPTLILKNCADFGPWPLDQGAYLDGIIYTSPVDAFDLGNAASAYDCCVLCINSPRCAGAAYFPGICYGATPKVSCSGNIVSPRFRATSNAPDAGLKVSNSGCGQWGPGTF